MILIQQHARGAVPLRDLPPDEVTDEVLDAIWKQLSIAHGAGLAHRALTADVVLVNPDADACPPDSQPVSRTTGASGSCAPVAGESGGQASASGFTSTTSAVNARCARPAPCAIDSCFQMASSTSSVTSSGGRSRNGTAPRACCWIRIIESSDSARPSRRGVHTPADQAA